MSARKRRSLLGSKSTSASAEPPPSRVQGPFASSDEPPGDATELPTESAPGPSAGYDEYDAPPPASMPPASDPSRGRAPAVLRAAPEDDEVKAPAYGGVIYEDVPPPQPATDLVIGADAPMSGIRATEPSYVSAGEGAKMDTSAVGWGSNSMLPAESPMAGRGAGYKTESAVYRGPPSADRGPPSADRGPPSAGEPEKVAVPAGAKRRGRPFDKTGDPLEDNPPTEEVPIGGIMSELSPPIGAPIDIPNAPPISGMVDRFTPSAVNRTDVGNRQSTRPKYLADDQAEGRGKREDKEISGISAGRQRRAIAAPETDGRASTMTQVAMALAAVSLVTILAGGLAVFLSGPGSTDDPVEVVPESHEGVEVRGTMRGKGPPPAGEPTPAPAEVAAPAPAIGAAPVVQPEAPPAPVPAPTEAPAAAPVVAAPRPAPPKPAPVAAPAATQGVLKITSNRRVLIYVNGSPVGYAPTEYKGKPGTYSVQAMVPGQPDTKQTRDAKIDATDSKVTVNFNF